MGGGGIIKPTGRRPELDSLPVRLFIIMEAKIMKMAKKFLAVALAGVLALSVLTGCGASVKSKDVADALTKMDVKVEQDKGVDATAKKTLKAIEAIVNAPANAAKLDTDDTKIKLDNAVKKTGGKVISENTITDNTTKDVQKALGVLASSTVADEKANDGKKVQVALVKTEDATKDASLQAYFVKNGLVTAKTVTPAEDKKFDETGKLGTATTKNGKYMLVVIVTGVVAK